MPNTNKPAISVVMPVKDGERYLRMALDSVLRQSFDNFEIIIVNDGSSDSTAQIIASYSDPRLIVIAHSVPQGVAVSLNVGIAKARGKYVARMDADDCCLPRRLERQFNYMEAHSNCIALGCSYYLMDENDKVLRKAYVPTSDAELRFMLLYSVPFCHPSLMYRRQVLIDNGLSYSKASGYAEDFEFLIRLSKFGDFACTCEYLFQYRTHAGGVSKAKRGILVKDFSRVAVPHIKNMLNNQDWCDLKLTEFVEMSASKTTFKNKKQIDDYMRIFFELVNAYIKTLESPEAVMKVKMNAAEILFKKILIKDRFIKQPSFLLQYMLRQDSFFKHLLAGMPNLVARMLWY
ncbi:MAG: glycosyltransferase [Cellvibrionaceae bacterium]|nr:glycosyltransferase [Cellvibrionaceae bacterium]